MAAERAFTARLARFFGAAADVPVSIGDDAAVVLPRGRSQVLCCDPVVAGVHFAVDTDLALVGRKAVNRNLSDVAAMGACADWLLVSLVLPADLPVAGRSRLLRGIRAAAAAGGAVVVGGDVAVHRGPLVVTVTAVGHVTTVPLRRGNARLGDAIHVTGPLGGSLLGHHLRFAPRLREGQWLARQRRVVGAAMDVSDGLLLDLATMLAASGGLGAEIDAAAVPVSRAARQLARGDVAVALRHALGDGEDHELLFTVRRGRRLPAGGPLSTAARRPIGRVVARRGLWLLTPDGRRQRLQPAGWQHAV